MKDNFVTNVYTLDNEDTALRINFTTRFVPNTFTISGIIRTTDGDLKPLGQTFTVTTASLLTPLIIPLSKSSLVTLSIVNAGTGTAGSSWAACYLQKGTTLLGVRMVLLCEGPLSNIESLSFPNTSKDLLYFERRYTQQVAIGNPGAGVAISQFGATFQQRRILALQATFTASAAAATRIPRFKINPEFSTPYTLAIGFPIVALGVWTLYFATDAIDRTANLSQIIRIPKQIYLINADELIIDTENFQAGDTFTAITVWYEDLSYVAPGA